jgi:hypothetical protein
MGGRDNPENRILIFVLLNPTPCHVIMQPEAAFLSSQTETCMVMNDFL